MADVGARSAEKMGTDDRRPALSNCRRKGRLSNEKASVQAKIKQRNSRLHNCDAITKSSCFIVEFFKISKN